MAKRPRTAPGVDHTAEQKIIEAVHSGEGLGDAAKAVLDVPISRERVVLLIEKLEGEIADRKVLLALLQSRVSEESQQ